MREIYKEQIEKVAQDQSKSKLSKLKDSYVDAQVNNGKKRITAAIGGALGTGVGLARKKSLKEALMTTGMAGAAIGDIAGATVFPARELYKRHIEEFGESPDLASTGKVIAASALPSVALWGAAYGTKAGINKRKEVAGAMYDGVKNNLQKPGKLFAVRDEIVDMIPSDGPRDANNMVILTPEQKKELLDYAKRRAGNIIAGDGAGDAFAEGGAKAFGKVIMGRTLDKSKGLAAPAVGLAAMRVPSMYYTPRNVIEAKKRKLEQSEE